MARSRSDDDLLDELPRVDLRIPGPWESLDEFRDALTRADKNYHLSEEALVHTPTGRRFHFGVTEHDDQIAEVFAGGGRITPEQVEEIDAHAVKIHLSAPGGSVEAVHELMKAAAAVVRAGGAGVMVDNSGTTHAPRDWLDLTRVEGDDIPGGCYWACVAVTAGGDEAFSSGMHCLGHRDAEIEIPPGGDREAAGFALHNFLGYVPQSGVTIADGDALGDETAAMFSAHARPCTRFPNDTPFFNPYGVWRLEAIESDDEEDDNDVSGNDDVGDDDEP
jgi:hypothetical protein